MRFLFCLAIATFPVRCLLAQSDSIVEDGKLVPRNTQVTLELIMEPRTAATGLGQEWSRELAQAGYSVQIRSDLTGRKMELTEQMLGRIRIVKAVGQLEADGTIHFPKQSFKRGDAAKLVAWLKELKSYGAQGAPEGKPLWGLNKEQFDHLVTELGPPIETDLTGKSFEECLKALDVPETVPLRWSLAAQESRLNIDRKRLFPEWQRIQLPVRENDDEGVQGMSLGSGLALILRHYGFGFWPSRTPAGTLELVIEPIGTNMKLWPLGFEPTARPDQAAPKFVKITEVGLLNDVPLLEVAQVISVQTETPIVFDTYDIERANIDLSQAKVSHPPRRRNWSLVLTAMLSQHKLTQVLRVDEQGRAFVLVRPRAAVLNALER
ncbi:MAG TPA: hypothetical protein VLA12_02140, partial [Planctomycetaceae bacterium]|nr:hypothetical protein [Planctomycetaceae bacterium]